MKTVPSRPFLVRWLFATALVVSAGCSDNVGESQRMPSKLSQIEVTSQSGSTTSIERTEFTYEADRLKDVRGSYNGTPNGTAQMIYGANGLERMELIDKDGDRAVRTFTFTGNRLTRTRFEITGVSMVEDAFSYDSAMPDLPKEIITTETFVGEMPTTELTRFEYDAQSQLAKRIEIEDDETESTEYRYTVDGKLERASEFKNGSLDDTYAFHYSPEVRLDEVTDLDSGRHELTYDSEGRISEIRRVSGSGTKMIRYTYVPGEMEGWSFQPKVPMSEMFDMSGASFATSTGLPGEIDVSDDIPPTPKPAPVCGNNVCEMGEPTSCSDCAPPPPPANATYRVHNMSTKVVSSLYVYPCSTTSLGANRLAYSLNPGVSYSVGNLAPGCWNLKAYSTDQIGWTYNNAQLTSGTTFELNLGD